MIQEVIEIRLVILHVHYKEHKSKRKLSKRHARNHANKKKDKFGDGDFSTFSSYPSTSCLRPSGNGNAGGIHHSHKTKNHHRDISGLRPWPVCYALVM
jgi:hypothetical protein